MKPFVIICQARSGSTMLGSALGRHPQVLMHGEVFGAHHFPLNFYGVDETLPWPTPIEIVLKRARDRDPINFLEEFIFADTGRTRVGFKFKYEEFSIWPQIVDYIKTHEIPVIMLSRADLFDRYISELEAEYSGFFNTTDQTTFGPTELDDVLSRLSIENLGRAIDKSLEYHNRFLTDFSGSQVLQVIYENLVSEWPVELSKICRFLDIAEINLPPITEKRSKKRLIGDLIDVNAARLALSELGYGDFL